MSENEEVQPQDDEPVKQKGVVIEIEAEPVERGDYRRTEAANVIAAAVNHKLVAAGLVDDFYTGNLIHKRREQQIIPPFLVRRAEKQRQFAPEAVDWIVLAVRLRAVLGLKLTTIAQLFRAAADAWGENEAARQRLEDAFGDSSPDLVATIEQLKAEGLKPPYSILAAIQRA